MNSPLRLALVIAGLILAPAAFAGLYKYVDDNGNVTYSQTPPESGQYEYMKTPGPKPASPAARTRDSYRESINQAAEERKKDEKVQEEMAKNEEIRKQNCEQAKKNLQAYTVYRHIRDEKGNVQRLDDKERAARIKENQQAIKDFCN